MNFLSRNRTSVVTALCGPAKKQIVLPCHWGVEIICKLECWFAHIAKSAAKCGAIEGMTIRAVSLHAALKHQSHSSTPRSGIIQQQTEVAGALEASCMARGSTGPDNSRWWSADSKPEEEPAKARCSDQQA